MNIQELIKVMHEWDMAPDGTLLREKPEGSTARHVFEKGVDATRRVWNEESTYTIEYRDGWQKWEGRAPFFDGNTEVECVLENRAVVRRKAKDMWRDVVVFRPVKPEPEVHYCAVYPNGAIGFGSPTLKECFARLPPHALGVVKITIEGDDFHVEAIRKFCHFDCTTKDLGDLHLPNVDSDSE